MKNKAKLQLAFALSLLYLVLGYLLYATHVEGIGHVLWPPAGIRLAAFLLLENWVAVPLVAVLSFGLGYYADHSFVRSIASIAGVVQGALGAYLIRRAFADPPHLFRRVRGIWLFVLLGATVSTLPVGATRAAMLSHSWAEFQSRTLGLWWASILGVLVVTPMIVVWAEPVKWHWNWVTALETLAVFSGLSVTCLLSFLSWGEVQSWSPLYYYCVIPFLLWATLRLGQRAAFTATCLVTGFVVFAVLGGRFTPLWGWGCIVVVAGLQLFHSASVEAHKDADVEQERLGSVLSETSDVVAITDGDGKIQYLNAAGWRLLGIREKQAASAMNISQLYPPEIYEAVRREYIPKVIQEGIWTGECTLWSWDGRLVPVSQVIIAHKDEDGKLMFFSTIARDLTELKTAQEALLATEKKFFQAQKMESIALLAGGIAHDFNNMLGVISGQAQLLMSDMETDGPAADRLKGISDAATRAAALTRQLLAFSRRQMLLPRVVNVNAAIRNLIKMIKPMLGVNIEVRTHLDEDLGNVNIDPGQLEQIVMNLAVNARDAMPDGGTLLIQTANRSLEASTTNTGEKVHPGEYVMLAVSDTGLGMDLETQSRIFEPFFTTKPSDKGTGLGLATVYGITKQSGGSIWVYSEPERGTTFGVYLPRVDAPAHPVEKAAAAILTGHESVLLVEDELALRALIFEILTRAGYKVISATPEDAFLIVGREHSQVDVLLTDIVMPRTNGQVLARRCLQMRPHLKVVFMSGYAPEMREENISSRQFTFIQKPFTSQELLQSLRLVLDTKHSTVAQGQH